VSLNCEPGDLAIVVRNGHDQPDTPVAGAIVLVLYATPAERFQDPDGFWHQPGSMPGWLVDFGKPRLLPTVKGTRMGQYSGIADCLLHPLRGDPDEEQLPREIEVPA
jgi:hypothetical protein